jgi:hypothetical protein
MRQGKLLQPEESCQRTCDGIGRRQGRQRAKFFDDARGSAIECAACPDASVAKGFAPLDRIQAGKEMLVRIVAVLTKLLMRFDPDQCRARKRTSRAIRAPERFISEAKLFSLKTDSPNESASPLSTERQLAVSRGRLYRHRGVRGACRLMIQICLLDHLCNSEPCTDGLKGLCFATGKSAVRDGQVNVAKMRKPGQTIMTVF